MDSILKGIIDAGKYLITAFIVFEIWNVSISLVKKGNLLKVSIVGLIICIVIALYSTYRMVKPQCLEYDYSTQGTQVCIEYSNELREANIDDLISSFAFEITLFYSPVILAVIIASRGSNKQINIKND